MTDAHDDTPSRGHNPSINFQPGYDDGLHEQKAATTILRIDHDTSLFERIGKVESKSMGVILNKLATSNPDWELNSVFINAIIFDGDLEREGLQHHHKHSRYGWLKNIYSQRHEHGTH
ncbi:MAG: hypothetical protein J07HQX50_02844 [Haloquadratum sp. J07HQX50]|jgi:hypothetical protein|nr:MAG: hypothetical protein J07HQX50_02844 [Haloquadratum sp. J07HQX50]